jgi:hypothetical protein
LKNKNKNLRYHFIITHKQFQKNVLLEYKIGFEGGEMGGKHLECLFFAVKRENAKHSK